MSQWSPAPSTSRNPGDRPLDDELPIARRDLATLGVAVEVFAVLLVTIICLGFCRRCRRRRRSLKSAQSARWCSLNARICISIETFRPQSVFLLPFVCLCAAFLRWIHYSTVNIEHVYNTYAWPWWWYVIAQRSGGWLAGWLRLLRCNGPMRPQCEVSWCSRSFEFLRAFVFSLSFSCARNGNGTESVWLIQCCCCCCGSGCPNNVKRADRTHT